MDQTGPVGYCQRCARQAPLLRPWPGFAWLKRAWFVGLFLVLALMPIIMSEITVLLPTAMIFALAGGPVLALSSQCTTCRECGAEVPARAVEPAQRS